MKAENYKEVLEAQTLASKQAQSNMATCRKSGRFVWVGMVNDVLRWRFSWVVNEGMSDDYGSWACGCPFQGEPHAERSYLATSTEKVLSQLRRLGFAS